ncbi:hypothetical protein B9Z55_011590 [Caenorhabditis nigoni]|uniref:F-box domain-containing protein n=1 Tax=Caenorhabditis nigoni TaxID=1611254 RepID=A0A2G5UKS9_9PELO|nr:hypothetical protein B9Z55_011590 [Caenorhabditis nigoni]
MLWFFVCWFTIAIVISLVYSQIGYLFCVLYSPQARFPLLKLDYVAIREVLSTLDPHDYINFLKVSKSCRRLSTIKKHSKARLIFKNFPRIIIGNGPGKYYVMWAQKVDTRAPCKQQGCIKCSQNCLNDMKKFYQDVRSVMGVEIGSVVLHMDDFQGRCSEIVSWFRSISQEVVDLSIYGKNPRHGDIQYLLDNLKCRDRLRIDVNTIEQLPFKIPESINTLFIIQGSWITLDYVMSLKISRMSFRNTYLTNQDINAFYKSWIEMESHQNLECFEINLINPANFVAVALRDIPYKTGTPIPKLFPDYAAIRGSFEVTRKDGQEASIVVFDLPEGAVASIYPWLPLINTEPIDRQ